MPGESIMQIMRRSSSIIIMENKSHPQSICVMKKFPPPLGQKSKI